MTRCWTNMHRPLMPIDLPCCEIEPDEALLAFEVPGYPKPQKKTYQAQRNPDGTYKVFQSDANHYVLHESWYRVAKWLQEIKATNLEVLS